MCLRQYTLLFVIFFALFASLVTGDEPSDEEFYILPDFVVTDDDDKGYYSANTLAGTRTNELTKNIPMTISTVNEEMIEDFKMKTLEDLGNFVPSIEAEGNVYNNNEIRFRGLLTKNQLYEFMPRYSPLDWYNVRRSDIIRGANSLIYGQADPGGKVNVISKNAELNKNKGGFVVELGDKSWHKFNVDWNQSLGENTAAKVMFVDKHREFDANYKYQSFTGATVEFLHQLGPGTRMRLHIENGESERSLIGGTFKLGNTPTGLPKGIVADPKLADLMSDGLLAEVSSFSEVNEFVDDDYNSIYPDTRPPNGLWEHGEILTLDNNMNGLWDPGDEFIDVSDGTRVYGFLSKDGTNQLSKNFTDTNNNGSWDTASKVIAYIESDNIPGLSYGNSVIYSTTLNGVYDNGLDELTTDINSNGEFDPGDTFTDLGSPWIPYGDLAVGHLQLNDEGELIERPDLIGLEGTDEALWATRDIRTNDGYVYFGDTNNDGEIGINPVTFEEDVRKMYYTWEDKNQNGLLDFEYNQETGKFTILEKVAFIDNNDNGTFDVSESEIHPDSIGSNTVMFNESFVALNPSVVNKEPQFTLSNEEYIDFNNNGIYDDADLALGGRQVRANNPNIWGITPAGGPLVPDFIDSREDIKNLFQGIDYSNSGTGFGPDSYSKKDFDYILADFEHTFTDNFNMKIAFAFEDLVDKQLAAGWPANQIGFSSGYGITVKFPTLRSINNYNLDPSTNGIKTPFESVLVDLTNANYAHDVLDTISAENFDSQVLKDDLYAAFNEWYNLFDSNPLNNLAPHDDENGQPVFSDLDSDGSIHDDMIDYFVDEFLDISDANTTLEKYYELAKFSGRVMDFLGKSHQTYGESLSYRWGNSAPNNGRSLKDHLYEVLRDEEGARGPENAASKQIYDLDRYIDVSKYRSELLTFSDSERLNEDSTDYHEIGENGTYSNNILGLLTDPNAANNPNLTNYLIDPADFSLATDGEKLIYDSIADWLIKGIGGVDREMLALPGVEIWNPADEESIDGYVNVDDDDEVDLQKRAISKKVYSILIENIENSESDAEFWDATKEVYDFFKYELHPDRDYGWIWEGNIQPSLLSKLNAILEDDSYLQDGNAFVDFDGDGERDVYPTLLKSNVEVLQPYIKREWKKANNKDLNRSVRLTLNYDEKSDIIPGKQQILLGWDLDNRDATRSEEQQVSLNARTWGDPILLYLKNDILSDYASLNDVITQNENGYENFDMNISGHQYLGAPNWITNNKIPLDEANVSTWAQTYYAESKVNTNGLWVAASGKYAEGKLNTLIGLRRDQIKTKSTYTKFTISNAKLGDDGQIDNIDMRAQVYEDVIYSPTIGGLFWLNENLAVFGNYSESVLSPNGFQFDVFGEITPPETGRGKEIGFKLSTPDNVFNGQLTIFTIDKKNEQRQNISHAMLKEIYPFANPDGTVKETPYSNGRMPDEIWDSYPYETREGVQMTDAAGIALIRGEFSPKGYRVADESVRSEGIELDLYYNPTKNLSLFLGYAFLDTVVLDSALDVLEGLQTAGTSDHNLNLTAKYSFKRGKLKGFQFGMNQKFRSPALLSHYFVDLDGDGDADYFAREVEDPRNGSTEIKQPRYHTLWLEDQYATDVFIKWSGKFLPDFPHTVLQMNVNNIFDNRSLISTGLNNARYTEGRNIVLSAGLYF